MDDPILTIKNKGVQILLNRMESNPEEFTARPNRTLMAENRWEWVIEKVINRIDNNHKNTDNYRMQLRFLTNEEVEALYDKYMSIQGEAFTRAIMQELLEEANEREQEANIVMSAPDGRQFSSRPMIVTKESGTQQQGGVSTCKF